MRQLLAVMLVLVAGCSTGKIVESDGLDAIGQAQAGIIEARAALTSLNDAVADNVRSGIWTSTQGLEVWVQSKAIREKLDEAQALLDAGNWQDANAKRELLAQLILRLHAKVAAAARSES